MERETRAFFFAASPLLVATIFSIKRIAMEAEHETLESAANYVYGEELTCFAGV
jgi:hypothetical protein